MATITLTLSALLALLFGILILIWPRSLNYFIAVYLILVGILGLFGGYYAGDLWPFY